MAIRVATGQLVGTLLELLAYGAYAALLPQGLIVLKRRGFKGTVTIYLLVTLLLSFIVTTVHAVVDIVRLLQAFGSGSLTDPHYPDLYFADLNNPLDLTKNSCYIIVTILADALIVFRTFIIWGRSYRVLVLPMLLLLADIATSTWFNWSLTANKIEDKVVHSPTWQITKYFCAVTLALNFLCTFLIGFRIWRTQKISNVYFSSGSKQSLGGALAIILESAAIYSGLLFAVLGLALASNGALFVILNLLPPVIGIIFFYVILKSSKSNSQFFATTQQTAVNSSGGGISHLTSSRKTRYTMNSELAAVHPEDGVHIRLEHVVHSDFDSQSNLKKQGLDAEHGETNQPEVASDLNV
ncbi:hypothetical protein K474DRAFT_1707113 [Panus rudis PR-1116 ss-1]|nr:hypothetical protein K474DRAFT_1707113 [Panus rudis PR-1116 ss-1]